MQYTITEISNGYVVAEGIGAYRPDDPPFPNQYVATIGEAFELIRKHVKARAEMPKKS